MQPATHHHLSQRAVAQEANAACIAEHWLALGPLAPLRGADSAAMAAGPRKVLLGLAAVGCTRASCIAGCGGGAAVRKQCGTAHQAADVRIGVVILEA